MPDRRYAIELLPVIELTPLLFLNIGAMSSFLSGTVSFTGSCRTVINSNKKNNDETKRTIAEAQSIKSN
jgi:hypothetical protein